MAQVRNNTLIDGISGKVGKDLVFKTWNGKTFVYLKAKKPKTQSPKQKENRGKFKKATWFAKMMMEDPVKKAEYWEKAKKLKLPNAYTAAITEYMRSPEIVDVDISGFKGKAGDEIKVTARKKDFEVEMVEVIIVDGEGKVIEEEKLIRSSLDGKWIFIAKESFKEGHSIHVICRDRCGNLVTNKHNL
ncbi:MAG TPA: hypothetical protein VD908_04725 [Cytophagales bacterium]|nr:hypothetical protein [Cytophagales bacterium]